MECENDRRKVASGSQLKMIANLEMELLESRSPEKEAIYFAK